MPKYSKGKNLQVRLSLSGHYYLFRYDSDRLLQNRVALDFSTAFLRVGVLRCSV